MIPIGPKDGAPPRRNRQAVSEATSSGVVPKPVPERQLHDARAYQVDQLRRRYSPTESVLPNGDTAFVFNLTPSDPDFPYDLDHLQCDLRVPRTYPSQPPRLLVKNSDIPRGFALNIERGWTKLVEERPGATLLSLTNALDKRLESLLCEQKAETVKLTIFKDTRHFASEPPREEQSSSSAAPKPPPSVQSRPRYVPEESFTREQIAEAKARRALEVRQLEARMNQQPFYHKSIDGIVYTLQLEPKRRAMLPTKLQAIQSAQLIIPLLYPLQPLRILLNDVESKEAEPVEELFLQKAKEQKHMSLMSHLNYITQNIHTLARQAKKTATETAAAALPVPAVVEEQAVEAEHSSTIDSGRSHIHVIPRPPEWALGDEDSDSSDDSSGEDYSHDEDGEVGDEGATDEKVDGPSLPTQTAERGIAISFPYVELYGIELLQVSVLALSLKCARCKTLSEIGGLKDNMEKASSCKKCATAFTVRFRQELVHQNSTRAGFIDVSGCTVADLLPRYAAYPITNKAPRY
ncbi:hypothetical protein B0T17DRAFT_524546 [Bombardia bombarda]|uniref:Uncharacterized protein n=1 Tax=Bombardia bombarda TaxID=252184 RepID=A0AA39X978_9PEZI|nr:hypothetical protein B0T17DRAFT_524546 [Bombardia bombarda]